MTLLKFVNSTWWFGLRVNGVFLVSEAENKEGSEELKTYDYVNGDYSTKTNTVFCSLGLGSHGAPELVLQASEEALHVGLGRVFEEPLGRVLLPRQPRVGLVEVQVHTGGRTATIQKLRRRWLRLPWITGGAGNDVSWVRLNISLRLYSSGTFLYRWRLQWDLSVLFTSCLQFKSSIQMLLACNCATLVKNESSKASCSHKHKPPSCVCGAAAAAKSKTTESICGGDVFSESALRRDFHLDVLNWFASADLDLNPPPRPRQVSFISIELHQISHTRRISHRDPIGNWKLMDPPPHSMDSFSAHVEIRSVGQGEKPPYWRR